MIAQRKGTSEKERINRQWIALLEDMLVRAAISAKRLPFRPLMIVDLCGGWFSVFVVSVDQQGLFRRVPRIIQVEEGERILNGLAHTRTCAYRRADSANWQACRPERLVQFLSDRSYVTTDHIIDYALSLPEAERFQKFGRLWHAFLRSIWQTDSSHDYEQVFVVVDSPAARDLIERTLPELGNKHSSNPKLWIEAIVLDVSGERNLPAYLALDKPMDPATVSECALYLDGDAEASVYEWRQGSVTNLPFTRAEMQNTITRAFVVADQDLVKEPPAGVHVFEDERDARTAMLTGYVYSLAQVSEQTLTQLQQQKTALTEQLARTRAERQKMAVLRDRFLALFGTMKLGD